MLEAWTQQLLAPRYGWWLLQGWLVTLALSAVAIAASTVLGVGLAAARGSGGPGWCSWQGAARAYLSLFRNTPLLVQLFFWYFGLPSLLPEGVREALVAGQGPWPSFEVLTATLGLVLYATAYVGEEIRAGIQGVPRSQWQAALALGLTPRQVFTAVVLPQALRLALPPLFGQYMNIVKNTSLVMAVGVVELSYVSRQIEAETFRTFQSFGAATLLYVATILALEALLARLRRPRELAGAGARGAAAARRPHGLGHAAR
ncbi:MAG: amino acid ABC transporter permease [Acidovorax sp.]|nr:amino acid ABC transporter permease [Acidovorax sp.]